MAIADFSAPSRSVRSPESLAYPKVNPLSYQSQSQAFKVNGTIYVAAQIAAAPRVGFFIGPPAVTAERIFLNIEAILKAAGSSLDRIVKTTVCSELDSVVWWVRLMAVGVFHGLRSGSAGVRGSVSEKASLCPAANYGAGVEDDYTGYSDGGDCGGVMGELIRGLESYQT